MELGARQQAPTASVLASEARQVVERQPPSPSTVSYSYNADDELLSDSSGQSYSYDADGNETGVTAVNGDSTTFAYDLAGRLLSRRVVLAGGPLGPVTPGTTSYNYDGDGTRLTQSSGTQATRYLWDVNGSLPQLALERDGAGSLLRRYIYGARRISMSSGGNSFYYHYDALGSVSNLTSSSGASEWTFSYDPFGNSRTATQNDPNAPANPMHLREPSEHHEVGMEHDPSKPRREDRRPGGSQHPHHGGDRLSRVDVVFEVAGEPYPLDERAATLMAENLRVKAAHEPGAEGTEGARAVADAIELRLIEDTTDPVTLGGDGAEAVFYALNVPTGGSARPWALYDAVKRLHDEWIR